MRKARRFYFRKLKRYICGKRGHFLFQAGKETTGESETFFRKLKGEICGKRDVFISGS